MTTQINRLSALFKGLKRAYGVFVIIGQKESGKYEGRASTLRKPVTDDLWERHVGGEQGLGIVPINEQNCCWWGCIDIDEYPAPNETIQKKLNELGLPLIMVESKSGGIHLFLFLQHNYAASLIQTTLKAWAEALGYGGCEVFPKQEELRKGETGNWLNMPYFGDTRKLYGGYDLNYFLTMAEGLKQTKQDLEHITNNLKDNRDPILDAPPCLQYYCEQGLDEGTRNDGAYSFAVLAKKARPDKYEATARTLIEKAAPDLPEREVGIIIASVGRSDGFYKCKSEPLSSQCNKDACATQRYGIGKHRPRWVNAIKTREGKYKPLPTIANLRALMEHSGMSGRYNLINKRIYTNGVHSLTGDEACALNAELISQCGLYGLSKSTVSDFLDRICKQDAINPVVDWLETLPDNYDSPVAELVEHCGFTNPAWAEVAVMRWLIQTVAAADHAERTPNEKARPEFPHVLIIAGPQGTSKTSLFYELLGENHDWFTSGQLLDLHNKDSLMQAVGNWMVELGEVDATFKRSDISAIKAFLTKHMDEIRVPYGRAATFMQRRTSFCATVNEIEFLRDKTGNRRYWPLEIEKKIAPLAEGLTLRLWSWVWTQYRAGVQWWLTEDEEQVHAKAIGRFEDKSMEGRLRDCYDFRSKRRDYQATLFEVTQEIGVPFNASTRSELGKLLKRLGIERVKGNRTYKLPPRTSANLAQD